MRVTESKPKTWLGALPKTTSVLLNGSLTNSCQAAPGVAVYGFMSTPSRDSTPWSGGSQLRPRSDSTVPAGARPSSPLSVLSWTMAPSAVTTENTALQLPSGEGPRNAVPTAPVLREPGMTWDCDVTLSRFVRLPA